MVALHPREIQVLETRKPLFPLGLCCAQKGSIGFALRHAVVGMIYSSISLLASHLIRSSLDTWVPLRLHTTVS